MKDEIKEINIKRPGQILDYVDTKEHLLELYKYITNLQEQLYQASLDIQELTEKDIGCPSWCDKLTNLQEENEELKAELQEENDSATWWSNRFKVVERDNRNYKSRNEKAIEYINIIKENTPSSTRKDFAKMILIDYENLVNILNGDDE